MGGRTLMVGQTWRGVCAYGEQDVHLYNKPSSIIFLGQKMPSKKNLNTRIRQKGGHTLRGGQTRRGGEGGACGEKDVHSYNKPRSIIFLVKKRHLKKI